MPVIPDRDARQRDIVPPSRLAACRVSIIGVGAVGRQVALQLAALGVPHLQLVDFDSVEPVNLAAQGYLEEDLDKLKVEATAALMRRIHSDITVEAVPDRFRRSMATAELVFCCVDQISTRKIIWDAVGPQAAFFADARMSAEVVRVLLACDSRGRRHYPTTLFSAGEAFAGSCTAKSTVFTANLAAGLMVAGFTQWLRDLVPEPDILLNLLAWEWSLGAVASQLSPSGDRALASLDLRERATVLAALRFHQEENLQPDGSILDGTTHDIASDGDRFAPLDASEIDRLCEKLNTAD